MKGHAVKNLIAYYTRTGNTKFVSEIIAKQLDADIEEVVDQKKRAGPIGWINAGKDSKQENETQINPTKYTPKDYELIIISTPVWAWRPTPAIRSYINKNDLSGKKIALILTCDGGPKEALERTKALLPNSTVIADLVLTKPLSNKEETEKKITEWCNTLKQLIA
jgi:flavodoxin